MADKIISASKSETKGREEDNENIKCKKSKYHQKSVSRLLIIWDCFRRIKMEYQNITNLFWEFIK